MTLSLRRFHQLAAVVTIGICVLVVAGGVVRLTGSGLGCDDWPNCNDERFVDVSTGHAAIEQANRLLSGLIGVPTIALALGAFKVRPRHDGLVRPSLGVLAAVLANGVVGGVAVRRDLHPALVQSHFILAMLAIAFGVVAFHRSRPQPGAATSSHIDVPRPSVRRLTTGLVILTAVALTTGTIVTGTGPHAGEDDVRRFGFDIGDVARIHSATVLLTVATGVWLAVLVHRDRDVRRSIGARMSTWMFVAVLQGVVGYVQYFSGVPELLVATHITLATVLWVVTTLLACDVLDRSNAPQADAFQPARAVVVASPAT